MSKAILYINGRHNTHERVAEIQSAILLGYSVVMLAKSSPCHVVQLCDECIDVDLDDFDKCLLVAKQLNEKYQFDGVVCWSETDVPLKNVIALSLGLPSIAEDVQHCRDKLLMKEKLINHRGLFPQCSEYKSPESLLNLNSSYPLIIKPSTGSGSKGIYKVNNDKELNAALSELSHIINPSYDSVFSAFGGKVIIEEFLDGVEFSVDGYVHQHEVIPVGITDYQSDDLSYVEKRHIFPSGLPRYIQDDILFKAVQIVSELDINNTMFHLEGKLTSQGVRFIECAARPAGGYISTHLIQYACNNSHLENYLRVCCGLEPKVKPIKENYYIGIRYLFALQEGYFAGLSNLDAVLSLPNVQHLFVNQKVGEWISLPPSDYNAYRVAVIIATASDYTTLERSLEEAFNLIEVKIQ